MTREKLIKKYPFFKTVDFEHALDSLTKVFTRDVMNDYMLHLIEKKVPFSLFIADIDNFKYVNDRHGHHAGDGVLARVAKFIKDTVGDKGVVGRFGGDEFLIVCEGMTEYNAVWELGHIINLEIPDVKFLDDNIQSVTITMGISRYPLDAEDYDTFWNLADKALYIGKAKGRNRFIIYLESKHKNIDLRGSRDVEFSPVYLHAKTYSTLTETDDLAKAIKNQLIFLASYNLYDHLCIETESGLKFNVQHVISRECNFKPMNLSDVDSAVGNVGLAAVSRTGTHSSKLDESLQQALEEQGIKSSVFCRISAYGKTYGYIRIDTTNTVRIWQNDELTLIVDTANAIGILLHYNNATIDGLDSGTDTVTVGIGQA